MKTKNSRIKSEYGLNLDFSQEKNTKIFEIGAVSQGRVPVNFLGKRDNRIKLVSKARSRREASV